MKISALIAIVALLPLQGFAAPAPSPETTLLSVPSAQGALESSRVINEHMHYAGTAGDKRLAQWMAGRLRADGFRTTIESFTTRVPQGRHMALEILSRPVVKIDLHEVPIAQDPDGTRPDAGVPFNAWSGSGTVTATLVPVGRGLDDDYRALAASHVDVRGKIALVRYGAEFRGLLAARAQQYGAAAVILYSDPADRDGSSHGKAFPDGPYRPLGSVQRGALGTGIRIPVLPVSALVAQRLLSAHALIRVTVNEPFARRTLWNTVGTLQGSDPAQEVVLGGHRDAWVYGVTDNGAGISTLLEAAKALGALARTGWRPRRSIVIAGWDGEEIGEVGSNAYVRAHRDRLRSACIAYVNMDEGTSGQFFGASAAGALASLMSELASEVADPAQPQRTLLARWQTQPRGALVRVPGGGSDFEPFLYDAGVPVMDSGFGGVFGVYHSGFDDLRYAMTEADPGFVNHRAMGQVLALAAYRLADEPLRALYRFTTYAQTLRADVAALPAADASAVAPLSEAVTRFAAVAAAAHVSDGIALDAAHRLNALCYGRNGYAAVPLPALAPALAGGDAASIADAAKRVADTLDSITAELSG
jgi:N-acetylated-alpha-linked acidic dipeptidase